MVQIDIRVGDITTFETTKEKANTSAIVNAANPGCLGGSGVDNDINTAGGNALQLARGKLPVIRITVAGGLVRCETGDAVITTAATNMWSDTLKVKHVIHAVPPNLWDWRPDLDGGLALLAKTYTSVLDLASREGITDIAFCILSGDVFSGGLEYSQIATVGLKAILDYVYLVKSIENVYVYAFDMDKDIQRQKGKDLQVLLQDLQMQATPAVVAPPPPVPAPMDTDADDYSQRPGNIDDNDINTAIEHLTAFLTAFITRKGQASPAYSFAKFPFVAHFVDALVREDADPTTSSVVHTVSSKLFIAPRNVKCYAMSMYAVGDRNAECLPQTLHYFLTNTSLYSGVEYDRVRKDLRNSFNTLNNTSHVWLAQVSLLNALAKCRAMFGWVKD